MKRAWPLLLIPIAVGAWFGYRSQDETRLTFLAVGQGDCIVLQTEGRTVLVDDGPAGNNWDAAKSIILPRLRQMGVGRIDLLILTHPDLDHVGGTATLLRAFPDTPLWVSQEYRDDPEMLGRLAEWRIDPKRVNWVTTDATVSIGATELRLFAPPYNPGDDSNDGSLFVSVRHGGARAVLTGDAPFQAEWAALRHGDWRAQVLKAGHHGSKGSTSASFLDAVDPDWLVVSCGRDNRYGHPAPETLERAKAEDVPIARTDLEGDIRFVVRGDRFVRD